MLTATTVHYTERKPPMSVTTALPRQPELARREGQPARTRDRAATRIVGIALALGWAADLIFYGKPLGMSALLFVGLILGALVLLGRLADVAPMRRNLWLIAPLLFFAAMIAVRANAFLTFLNVVACLTLLALVAYFYAAGRADRLGLIGYPIVLCWT